VASPDGGASALSAAVPGNTRGGQTGRLAYTAPVHVSDQGRYEELNRRGLAAAAALAARLSLPAADPAALSARGNLLVHFAPAPVVARVATLTAWSRRDPFAWLAREVAVAGWVAGRGGPVVPPSRVADPGPHVQDGFAISLWEFTAGSPRRPSPAELGAALADLHLAAAGCPADLGHLTPARDQISDGLDALERASVLAPAEADALRARHELLLGRLGDAGPAIVLHGDAHAGNLIAAADAWRWIDLEECCRGPAEWDLATMADQAGDDAAAALRGYADRSGRPVPRPGELAPFHDLRMLEAVVWTSCMAHLYPARYRDQARERLATMLGK
jgi:Ser/Thr protein kinase RdoA (MazF antagonist)